MINNFYRTGTFDKEHIHFGGRIYPSDFNTDYRGNDSKNGSSVAKRIMDDWKFDQQCKRNAEFRSKERLCSANVL